MGTDAPQMSTSATATQRRLTELGIAFDADAPLGPLTWYGIGGRASVLARPADVGQLAALVRYAWESGQNVRVLGKGANLLVGDGVIGGIVVLLDAEALRRVSIEPNGRVVAGGGADLERLITATVREGLGGLEVLAGIPATIGGAIRMNAGGAFGEIGPVVESVTLVEPDGSITTAEGASLDFGYRRSAVGDRIVAEARFALRRVEDQPALRERLKEVMAYKKRSQPMGAASAGCAFKNPRGRSEHGAGKLIDLAGLKGERIGGAEVSPVHANFIVAHPGATAGDVLALIERVVERVRQVHGVELERELVVWE